MQEMTVDEVNKVNRAGFWSSLGYALGFAVGGGTCMREYIDAQENQMLSAMQYGA